MRLEPKAGINEQMLEPAPPELIGRELDFPRKAFIFKKAIENLKIETSYEDMGSLVNWSFN